MQLFITCTEIEHQLHHYAFFTIRAGEDKKKKEIKIQDISEVTK